MKKNKVINISYAIASIILIIIGIVLLIMKNNRTIGIICLCFGSFNLCLCSVYINKLTNENS